MRYKRIRTNSFKSAVSFFDRTYPNFQRIALSRRYRMRGRYYVNIYYKIPAVTEKCWVVQIRVDYKKRKAKTDLYIEAEVYVRANYKEDAELLAYQRVLNFFDRDEEYFVPFDDFRLEAFEIDCSKAKDGVIKWKHAEQDRFRQTTLSSWI